MQTGDIFASGTISGSTSETCGSLLEITWAGKNPILLPTGERRTFIEDQDTIVISGFCQGKNYRVGFGEVSGKILPAIFQ